MSGCPCRACRDVGGVYGLPLELGTPHGTVATLSLDRDGLEWLVSSLSNQWRDEAVEEMRRALDKIDERIAAHEAEDRSGISIRLVMKERAS